MRPAWFVALVTIGLAGCARWTAERAAGSAETLDARRVLDALERGDTEAVLARIDDSIRTPNLQDNLRWMAGLFPPGVPSRIRMVGFEKQTSRLVGGSSVTELCSVLFETNYASDDFLSQVVLKQVDGGPTRVVGLHSDRLTAPLAVVNAFSLPGPNGMLFLWIMATVAAVTVAALVVWVRRGQQVRRRWLWLVAILVGTFQLALNWKTGQASISAMKVQLFSLSAVREYIDGPWILSFSIPSGAIAFLIRYRRRAPSPIQEPEQPAPLPGA